MDVGGYRHNYEGFYEKTSYQMSINRGRTTTTCGNSPLSSLSLLVKSFEEEIQLRMGKDRPRFGRPNRTETVGLSKSDLTVSVKIRFGPPRPFGLGPNRKEVNSAFDNSVFDISF